MAESKASKQLGARALTVRMEQQGYLFLKELADSRGVSVNALAAEAVAEFARRLQREQVIREIKSLHEEMRKTGRDSIDSVELIRQAREERAEHIDRLTRPRRPNQ